MGTSIFRKYITVLLLSILFVHILYSLILSKITTAIYDHRLINVRKFDNNNMKSFNCHLAIYSFLQSALQSTDKPVVLVLGSSFSWGYPWNPENIFSYQLQQLMPDYKVMNASVVGASQELPLCILMLMKKLNIKVSKIIIELNLSNFYNSGSAPVEAPFEKNKFLAKINSNLPHYLGLYLANPFGSRAIDVLLDEYDYKQSERFFVKTELPSNYFRKTEVFQKGFESSKGKLNNLFSLAQETADQVYFFISPVLQDGMPDTISGSEVLEQMSIIQRECTKYESIQCINMGITTKKSNYSDVTHLNIQGHMELAQKLFQILTSKN